MIIHVYDTVRVFNQKNKLIEINTWVKHKVKKRFTDYKRLNTILVCESNL
jgi:hypothetical protein